MNRDQINSTVQSWMSKQHTKQVINGQLVVEDGKVSLQQEDGSLVELSKHDRIEVMNGNRFEPAPYSRIIEKVDTQGWPIYAGLYASVERNRSEPPSLKQIAHRLFNLVEKWRTPEELIEIGTYFRTYAANIAGGWKEKEEYQAVTERELQNMDAFFAARHLYHLVAEGMTTDELLEIGRLIKVIAKERTPAPLRGERNRTEMLMVASKICELLAHHGIQPGEVGEVFKHAIDIITTQVLVVPKEKAPAVTEAESYTKYLPCGTKTKLNLSIEISELDSNDLQEVLSFISTSARHFYLSVGNKLSNMP